MNDGSATLRLCLPLLICLLVANCALASGDANKSAAIQKPASGSPIASEGSATGYLISSHDILDIAVFQVQDLNKTVEVGTDGYVSLPLIGKAYLAGKTTHEAEEIIADKLRKKYLQSPQVSVSIKQYGQQITISGAVKTPRVVAADGKITLSQAVAEAGGPSELADTKRVHIARRMEQRVEDDVYDLDAIQSGRAVDPVLQAGDIIVAEESGTRVAFKTVKDLLPFAILGSVL